jgi:hypothetical protein
MIRIALISIGTFLVGILIASIINSSNMTQLQNEHDEKIAQLTQELAKTHASLADALTIPERVMDAVPSNTSLPEPEEEVDVAIEVEPESEPSNSVEGETEAPEAVQERRGRGDREGRSAEMFQEMRERYMGAMDEMWEDADADTQERITAIVEYQEEMFQIGQQMRDAETDEERTEIRATMRENMENMQTLMREQQNTMLGKVVGEFGISDPKTQKKLTKALRETMNSPLYNVGGGRSIGGRGGFPGGIGRRSGGEGGGSRGGNNSNGRGGSGNGENNRSN